ncbi:MAG TPA: ABC transporter ATP-binding protein [Chloroflexia bacterium]|nr:ABC transporter ATP-binding protein [Chloroflexia bacterium]
MQIDFKNQLDKPKPINNLSLPVATDKDYAIEFENVSRRYRLHHEAKLTLQDRVIGFFKRKSSYEDFWALKNISFKLERGKTLGIIGQNGAGKSTLLKLATHILEPTSGTIRVNGRVSAMLELGTGFHPELTARDNIYLNGAFYGFNRQQMDERYERIVEFSELGKFIDTPVKHYSSGMYMRLGFAVAITVDPDILIIDEVLAVGDAAFARKCHLAIEDLKNRNKTMLFVSHTAGDISRFCDEVIYLSKGEVVSHGKAGDMLDEYMLASMGPSYFIAKAPTSPKESTKQPAKAQTQNKDVTEEEALLSGSKGSKINSPDRTSYQSTLGISQISKLWQFNLSHVQQVENRFTYNKDSLQRYLAVLNTTPEPTSFKVTGYKPAEGLLDRAAGIMHDLQLGEFQLPGHQTTLLKLEEKAINRISQLQIESKNHLAVEVVEYDPDKTLSDNHSSQPNGAIPGIWWFFPFCDTREANRVQFTVLNPSTEPVEIYLSLFRDGSGVEHRIRTYQCLPHAELFIDLNDEMRNETGFFGSVMLEGVREIICWRYTQQVTPPSSTR